MFRVFLCNVHVCNTVEPRQLELGQLEFPTNSNLIFFYLDQNFTEIYPDNSNSLLTRTVFRVASYMCSLSCRGSTVSISFGINKSL